MATKRIEFKDTSGNNEANGADGVLVGGFTDASYYAAESIISGFRCGWIGAAGASTNILATGVAAPRATRTTQFPGSPRTLRIDRPAGTFLVILQALVNSGTFRSSNIDILDADGTTVLHTMSGVEANGEVTDMQFNTSGAMVAVGAADAGVTITTTGPQFFVRHKADDTYAATLSFIEFFAPDPAPPVYTAPPVLTNPNVDYVIGALLSPITLQAKDQFGANYTGGGLSNATVTSLSLPVTVVGTTTVAANQATGVWTFDDLTPTDGVVLPSPPVITNFTPTSGPEGTSVVLIGTGFTGATSVRVGTIECAFSVVSDTAISAVIPVGA